MDILLIPYLFVTLVKAIFENRSIEREKIYETINYSNYSSL